MSGFTYVYMLQSLREREAHYVGITFDLKLRLEAHNAGCVPATKSRRPCRIKTAVAFSDGARARTFERYLESASGRAFARTHS